MENEEEKKNLYAFRSVLTANRAYFKASNSFRVITYLNNSVPAGNRRKKWKRKQHQRIQLAQVPKRFPIWLCRLNKADFRVLTDSAEQSYTSMMLILSPCTIYFTFSTLDAWICTTKYLPTYTNILLGIHHRLIRPHFITRPTCPYWNHWKSAAIAISPRRACQAISANGCSIAVAKFTKSSRTNILSTLFKIMTRWKWRKNGKTLSSIYPMVRLRRSATSWTCC